MLVQIDDHPVHSTPNHHPPKMEILHKKFLQIILSAKWLVQHSSMSPNQQRRPLPSLPSDSFSMVLVLRIRFGARAFDNADLCFFACLGEWTGPSDQRPWSSIWSDIRSEGQLARSADPWGRDPGTLLEHLTDDAISYLYVTKFPTISLDLTKLYVT